MEYHRSSLLNRNEIAKHLKQESSLKGRRAYNALAIVLIYYDW